MKVAETKTSAAQIQAKEASHEQPFFAKQNGAEPAFFSKNGGVAQPFFSPGTIQPKLKIGSPNDFYERQADAVADQVVAKLNAPAAPAAPAATPAVQAKGNGAVEEEPLQKKEEMPEKAGEEVQRKPIFEGGAPLSDDDTAQRKCAECEKEETGKIQRKAEDSGSDSAASPDVSGRLQSTKGRGTPLPHDTRSSMESTIGADFSGVRVHTGSEAAGLSQDLSAQAFTHGSDIYFNEGKYNPGSMEGQRLLAHELTHTVQQGGSQENNQIKNKASFESQVMRQEMDGGLPDATGAGIGHSPTTEPADASLPAGVTNPIEQELQRLWATGEKGVFFERLRNMNAADRHQGNAFVQITLLGDDLWLAESIITYGIESQWPIHLKVEYQMKPWVAHSGKAVVFEMLRTANATESANTQLTTSIQRVFSTAPDDLWLAQNLQAHGRETQWPIDLRIERELKGWTDTGGFSAALDLIATATEPQRQAIFANAPLIDKIRAALTFDNANLLRTSLTEHVRLGLAQALVTTPNVKEGPIRSACKNLLVSAVEADRNTAIQVMRRGLIAMYFDELAQPANINATLTAAGLSPSAYAVYISPVDGHNMFVQLNGIGTQIGTYIIGQRSLTPALWESTLIHEGNHALNTHTTDVDAANSLLRYKSEFRAYWIAEFRNEADLDVRATNIKNHILNNYLRLKTYYDTVPTFKTAVDAHTRPDGNLTNR